MPSDKATGGWWDAEELQHESRFVASHGISNAKRGEELYCISAGWLRSWKHHVERLNYHESHHHHIHVHFPHLHLRRHGDRHEHHRANDVHHHSANDVPHPGPITNWDLLDSSWHYDRLRQGLIVGQDYDVVTRAVWNFLQPIYGGGPAISVPACSKDRLSAATIHMSQVCDFQDPETIEDFDASASQDLHTWTVGSWTSGMDSVSKSVRNMFQPPSRSHSSAPLASPRLFKSPSKSSKMSGSEIGKNVATESPRRPEESLTLRQPEEPPLPADDLAAKASDDLAAVRSMSNFMLLKIAQAHTPMEEHDFVSCHDVPQDGQKWHFVESGWLRQWKNHVVHAGPHPGPISNWKLLDNVHRLTPKPDLVAGKHYRGIGPAAWNLLHETYGGGPRITSVILSIYAADNFEEMEGLQWCRNVLAYWNQSGTPGDEEQVGFNSHSHDRAHDLNHSPRPEVHHEAEGAHSHASKPLAWKSKGSSSSISTTASVSSVLKALATAPMKRAKALLGGTTFEV